MAKGLGTERGRGLGQEFNRLRWAGEDSVVVKGVESKVDRESKPWSCR